MKILSPLSHKDEVRSLIEAGANEFYTGLFFENWEKKYAIGSLNRRAQRYANLSSMDELKRVLEISHSFNVPVFLLMNNMAYTPDQIRFLLEAAHRVAELGVDAIVVSDPGLLLEIKDQIPKMELHMSTTGATFNSETAKFYHELGASRIVLDRQLTMEEIKSITGKAKDIKFEVFVFNWKCMYVEGLCTIIPSFNLFYNSRDSHESSIAKKIFSVFNIDPAKFKFSFKKLPSSILKIFGRYAHLSSVKNIEPCCFLYSVDDVCNDFSEKDNYHAINHIRSCFQNTFVTKIKQPDCGLCAITDLKKIGIHSIKMVGRVLPLKKKLEHLRLIRRAVQFANEGEGCEVEVKKKIKEMFLKEHQIKKCDPNGCYY